MKHKELISELAAKNALSKEETAVALTVAVQIFQENLAETQTIGIQGFGTFEVKKKEERLSFNPLTKTKILVPPKLVIGFRPSHILKTKLKSIS